MNEGTVPTKKDQTQSEGTVPTEKSEAEGSSFAEISMSENELQEIKMDQSSQTSNYLPTDLKDILTIPPSPKPKNSFKDDLFNMFNKEKQPEKNEAMSMSLKGAYGLLEHIGVADYLNTWWSWVGKGAMKFYKIKQSEKNKEQKKTQENKGSEVNEQ